MTKDNPSLVFTFVTSASPPAKAVAEAIQTEAGMTITVKDLCPGKAMDMAEFIRESLEHAGIAGAEHAGKALIAQNELLKRYTSITVDHVPRERPAVRAEIPCRHANFGLTKG